MTYSNKVMNNKKIIQKARDAGFKYEKCYRGCAQCTLAAVQDAIDIQDQGLFRAASGLASGGGLLCTGSCGGYSAGIMMISSMFGRRRENFDNDNDFKYSSFKLARDLNKKFEEKYGSIICGAIHKKIFGRTYNLLDSEQKKLFEEDGAHTDKCTSVVADAAAWTTEIILTEMKNRGLTLKDLPAE